MYYSLFFNEIISINMPNSNHRMHSLLFRWIFYIFLRINGTYKLKKKE